MTEKLTTLRFVFGVACVGMGTVSSNLPGYAVPGLVLALIGIYFTVSAWATAEREDAAQDRVAFRRRYARGEWYMPPRGTMSRSSAEVGVAFRRLVRSFRSAK